MMNSYRSSRDCNLPCIHGVLVIVGRVGWVWNKFSTVIVNIRMYYNKWELEFFHCRLQCNKNRKGRLDSQLKLFVYTQHPPRTKGEWWIFDNRGVLTLIHWLEMRITGILISHISWSSCMISISCSSALLAENKLDHKLVQDPDVE